MRWMVLAGQAKPSLLQQNLQLARAPVRVTQAQFDDALLQLWRGLLRTVLRTATLLGDGGHAACAIALQPKPTGRTRDVELATRAAQGLLAAQGRNHESYPLLSNFHRLPSHPASTSALACARAEVESMSRNNLESMSWN